MDHRKPDTDTTVDDGGPGPDEVLEIHPGVITGATILGLLIALVVGAASFKQSFSTLYDLALMGNISDPWVTPIAIDGPILAAGVIRIALSQHTDRSTVIGRRFVVAVLIAAGALSMAANAYHSVLLGAGALNAAVAAGIGALAPLMVMVMSDIVAVILRAPRRRRAQVVTAATSPDDALLVTFSEAAGNDDARTVTELVDEHGALDDDVWRTVDLYHNDPACSGNFTSVARKLGIAVSTATRRYDKWLTIQRDIAATKAQAAQHERTPVDAGAHADDAAPADVDDGADRLALVGSPR